MNNIHCVKTHKYSLFFSGIKDAIIFTIIVINGELKVFTLRKCIMYQLIPDACRSPVYWPPKSTDFTPPDFYFWGT